MLAQHSRFVEQSRTRIFAFAVARHHAGTDITPVSQRPARLPHGCFGDLLSNAPELAIVASTEKGVKCLNLWCTVLARGLVLAYILGKESRNEGK